MSSAKIKDFSSKIKIVIGNLLKNADSICKRVLTLFDPSKDSEVNIGKLSNVSRTDLESLSEYLGIPVFQDREQKKKMFSSKKKLAKRIVMEIMALYPAMCPECNEEYKVMHGHQPPTRCWICLQGSHDCVELTAKIGVYMSLPSVLNGMVWLCGDCLTLNNPFPQSQSEDIGTLSGLNTPKFNKSTESRDTTQENLSNEETDDLTRPKTSQSLGDNLAARLGNVLNEQEKSESKPNTCKHVCPRLMEGSCPHGVSGKKAAEGKEKCELFHPKRCHRYMAFYTHETKGCTKGEDCDSLHVNLCKSSIESKKCLDVSCKATHLKGTKRPKSMLKSKSAPSAQDDIQKYQRRQGGIQTKFEKNPAKDKKNRRKESESRSKPTSDSQSSFLEITSRLEEMKSALVEEMKLTVQREMKAVRTELDLYKQQLDLLRLAINPQPAAYNPAMAYYGPSKPTPCEMPQCHRMWFQKDRFPNQNQPLNTTPIPPVFY